MMTVAHFYHVWTEGDWQGPTIGSEWQRPGDGHVAALGAAGLRPDLMVVGLVGHPGRRRAAQKWWRRANVADNLEFTEADEGYEQVTLRCLREWVATADPATSVLYAHTKGAYNLSPVTAKHREFMTAGVVGRWREAVAALTDHDVAGCFWEPRGHPEPHFTGNFWWARAGYLATLSEVPDTDRYAAELWLGQGHPSVLELADFTYEDMVQAVVGRPEPERPGIALPPGVSMLGSPVPGPPSIPYNRAGQI